MLTVLVSLLLCGCCGVVPLAPPGGRQVAPSQHILGELQQLFRQAAAGQSTASYGAARDQLGQLDQLVAGLDQFDQLVSGLDQLAAVVPIGQELPVASAPASVSTKRPANVPIIDPGLFVIQGVKTCGAGNGYCMLGYNCSLDTDFQDDLVGHCDGLRTAFTPAASFACCRFNSAARQTATPRPTPTTTEGTTFDDGLIDSLVNFGDETPDKPIDENSQIVDIVAIITDSTGIVDIVTRPYTGPWPPEQEEQNGAVTLPFAKPGDTFPPEWLAGLGQNGVHLATNAPPATDPFEAGDLPAEVHQEATPAGQEDRLTTVAVTSATVVSTTASTPATSGETPPSAQAGLGPLAGVPVMPHDQDYIGDIDYDQHLLPALTAIRPGRPGRPGSKTDAMDAATAGSGDAPAGSLELGDDLLLQQAPVWLEGSGSEEAPETETGELLDTKAGQTPPEAAAAAGSGLGAAPAAGSDLEAAAAAGSGLETSVTHGAGPDGLGQSLLEPALGSLSANTEPPVCGMMGSSLANLLARSRYRQSDSYGVEESELVGEVTSTVVWCWMAAIMRRTRDPNRPYSFVCAGTLVEQDLVLTTAECGSRLFSEPLRDFVVLLGASNLLTNVEFGVQHMDLEEIIVHENYRMDSNSHANNIGLLKLTRRAAMVRTVCLLCLPPERMHPTSRQSCFVTGYGLTDSTRRGSIAAQHDSRLETVGVLRQTPMPLLAPAECSSLKPLAHRQPHNDGLLCAGDHRSGDACYIARDGGSPLACMAGSGRYYLYGMVSWDTDCRRQHDPRVYTSIATHFTWIQRNYQRMGAGFRLREELG